MSIETEPFRTALLEERERVEQAIANLREDHPGRLDDETEEVGGITPEHLGDTATATLDREIDYTLEENSIRMLTQIDAALKRIDDGTYGICTNCGREIPRERLEAYPWASLCIDCQRQAERR
ncbi:MAG TPA: TraR/DksA C4-type zinc finger protein [Gaiellaceae bacterium]|nr:TraR/DksA C4-type zinc finger protein [Gaiellaceae bacterium]